MKIQIKDAIINEGILDGFRSNVGLGVTALAGGLAGAGIKSNYDKSGATSVGKYLGQKMDQTKEGIGKFKDDILNKGSDAMKDIGDTQTISDQIGV